MDGLSHHDIGELSDVIRPLDSLEHLSWLADQNRPVHFAVTAQVSGKTSVRDWREALARLKERHSLLSASIEGEPGAVPWFRQVNTAPIPLRVVHGDPQSRWEAEVAEELATPFDPRHAPLVRPAAGAWAGSSSTPRTTPPSRSWLTTRSQTACRSPMQSAIRFARSQVPFSNHCLRHPRWRRCSGRTVRRAGQLSPTGSSRRHSW